VTTGQHGWLGSLEGQSAASHPVRHTLPSPAAV